ncbi:MAG: AbrB/MazE/SpoVT family DNA-binding domain-containing protein [Verrucomicrobiota bacterium]|jgi:AbrB family looped-hinge helix DNA binding protein
MTVVHMSETGQIVVPKDIRDQHGFGSGSAFAVLESKSGDIIFRPVKAEPKMDLVDHLLRLKGVEIPERTHFCPPQT